MILQTMIGGNGSGSRVRRSRNGRSRASRSKLRALRPFLEVMEDRVVLSQLMVTSPLDPATLTAGTLRYAVYQANADTAKGISDTIVLNTTQMVSTTITLHQGQLEFSAGGGTTTINGGGQVTISGNNTSLIFQVDQERRSH